MQAPGTGLRSTLTTVFAVLALLLAQPRASAAEAAGASGIEAPAHLSRLAEQWLATRHPWQGRDYEVRITAQALDARTRLPACRQAIAISLPPGQRIGSRSLLQLQCPDSPGWRLLQPVTIEARAEVLVASQAIPAGTTLTPALAARQWRDVATLAQGYLQPSQLDGLRARMTIPAGAIIALPWVQALPVIRKGQQVNLQVQLGSIAISMAGEALADAAPGERVRVRNRQSGKMVEGLVRADGQVEIQP